jgi:hypothetical protein
VNAYELYVCISAFIFICMASACVRPCKPFSLTSLLFPLLTGQILSHTYDLLCVRSIMPFIRQRQQLQRRQPLTPYLTHLLTPIEIHSYIHFILRFHINSANWASPLSSPRPTFLLITSSSPRDLRESLYPCFRGPL